VNELLLAAGVIAIAALVTRFVVAPIIAFVMTENKR